MKWIIYTLSNPRTGEVRYVGFTSKGARTRLKGHLDQARLKVTHKDKWILSLLSIGLVPALTVLESGSGDGWQEAEKRWIAAFRLKGARLANGTDGGDGGVGLVLTTDERARRSEVTKKKWAELSPEARSARVKPMLASRTREARVAPLLAISRETRQKQSKKRWDNMTLGQRKHAMAAAVAASPRTKKRAGGLS